MAIHNSCACNEMQSLVKRHLIDWSATMGKVTVNRKLIRGFSKQFKKFLNFQVQTTPYQTIVNKFSGPKKRRYIEALKRIREGKRIKAWSKVSMFVKPDKYPCGEIKDKSPRAIQFRNPCYTLMLSKFLHEIEEKYYQITDWTGQRVVAKGLNNIGRAENIVEASKLFRRPAFFLMDHSKFDAHVTVEHLRWIHSIYRWLYRGQGSKLRTLNELLNKQLKNVCFTKNGIKYYVHGTRMSGDSDTALGNTLLNHLMISIVFQHVKHHILVDGDDSVVIIEESDIPKIDLTLFTQLGMHTTTEVVHDLNDVEFCRAKLLVADPPRFAREPMRALSNLNICLKNYDDKTMLRHVAGLGLCEAAASSGVPILGVIGQKMAKAHDRALIDDDMLYRAQYTHGMVIQEAEITMDVRLQYYRAFNITPEAQMRIEENYQTPQGLNTAKNLTFYANLPLDNTEIVIAP